MKRLFVLFAVMVVVLSLSACATPAENVSENLSQEAEQFRILRKVVFYNGITDEYMFAMEGYCSIEADTLDDQLEVTCKVGENDYEKHFLGLSDNVTYMVIQLETATVDPYHFKIYLRPQTLVPDIELDTSEN